MKCLLGNGVDHLAIVEFFNLLLDRFRDVGHSGRGVVMTIHLFDEVGYFPRRNALAIKLNDRCLQCVTTACIIRNKLLFKFPFAVSGNMKVEFAVFRVKHPVVKTVAAVTATPAFGIVFLIAKECGNFCLKQVVDGGFQLLTKKFINRVIFQ